MNIAGRSRPSGSPWLIRNALHLAVSFLTLLGCLWPPPVASQEVPSPRRIVFILADDLGYHCLSAYGSDQFRTPHLDRLARSGMVLTNCHARAMCVPTRTALLGGRTLDRARMGLVPKHSIAEVMTANAYHCGFSGKWMQRNMPWNHGFAEGLVQVNWYKYYGPHFVVFNSGGYLREHNLPTPLPEKMQDRDLPVDGEEAKASFKVLRRFPRLNEKPAICTGFSIRKAIRLCGWWDASASDAPPAAGGLTMTQRVVPGANPSMSTQS